MNKFTSDFEINDYSISIRNVLTKGQVHEEIALSTGATISTRGRFVPPDLKNPLNRDRPLYLFVQANSQEKVDLAIKAIVDRINFEESKFAKLTNKTNFQKNLVHLQNSVAKLPIILDAPPAFELRNRVIGADGTNLNYIQSETGAIVTLRGKGSMFVDPTTQTESNEPLHLYIEHSNSESLQEAKQLAKNLIETIQQDLTLFKSQNNQCKPNNPMPQQNPPGIIQNNQQITIPAFPPPSLVQQPNYIQQAPPTILQAPQNTTNTIIHQNPTTTFHSVPMQILQNTPITIPPPPIRTQPIVQLQQPTNIQIQGANGQQAQILVNQPQQYQLQYIQAPNQQITNNTNQQQTIQHFIQPQQQIQGIIHTTPLQQQIPTAGTQQIITLQSLQGNAFMIPPPNIISQQPPSIIQTAGEINLNPTEIKEEKDKNDDSGMRNDKPDGNNLQVATTRAILATPMTITNINPLMTVPPPNIQQIIGNTLITHPPPTQTQTQSQIFNQIPVSIQQQPQQIQVSGGHFILQNQPWQQSQPQNPQAQQITQLNPIQQIRNANEIIDFRVQNSQPQQQIIQTFNPTQMQIQFPPQIIQQQQQQIIETQQPPQPQQQQQQVVPPPNQQNQSYQQQGGYVMFNKQPNDQQQQQQRLAHKRKHPSESDEDNKNINQPNKTGIGCSSNSFGSVNNQMGAAGQGQGMSMSVAVGGNGGGLNNNNIRPPMPFNNKNQKINQMRMNVNNNYKNNNNNNYTKINRNNNNNNDQQRNIAAPIGGPAGSNNMPGNVKIDKPPPGEQLNDDGRNRSNLQMNQRQENFDDNSARMMHQQRPPQSEQMMRGSGNQNFRFGPPGNFMGGQHQNPPPNVLPQQNFNQNRNMMGGNQNNPPGGFQQPPPQQQQPQQQQQQSGNQFMPNQIPRPMMQDMNNFPNNFNNNNNSNFGPRFSFGPPPPPPGNTNMMMGNNGARNFPNQPNHGPRFRQQW